MFRRYCLMIAILIIAASPAAAQEGQAMPEMGRPAQMDAIAFMQGDWNVKMEMRMGPDAPWTEAAGTATSEAILDGCVQHMNVHIEDMMGMPMNGIDNTTYNRETKRYESVWVDSMTGKFTVMSGNFVGDALVMTGRDQMMGMEYGVRTTSTKKSDKEVVWTMENSMDGDSWFLGMRMTYTRK